MVAVVFGYRLEVGILLVEFGLQALVFVLVFLRGGGKRRLGSCSLGHCLEYFLHVHSGELLLGGGAERDGYGCCECYQ